MEFKEVFEQAAKELFSVCPPGKRTFSEMQLLILNKYGNEPETRGAVHQLMINSFGQDVLYTMMENSEHDFDLFYPRIKDKVTWSQRLSKIEFYREPFSEMAFDNQFLLDRISQTQSDGELIVDLLPGLGERGNRYCVTDLKNGVGYVVKPYQGGHEKEIMLAFSDNIGPLIYFAGKHSFVEEIMIKLNLPNAPDVHYLHLGEIELF
jgi:hypothetical protein